MNLEDYLNNTVNKTVFVMVGIPGSGKSTIAESLKNDHTVIFSSDAYREKIFGDASVQCAPSVVFETMYSDAISILKSGKSIIIDATNIKIKDRKNVIKKFTNYSDNIVAIIVNSSIENCIIRDSMRNRTVGEEVIKNMYKKFVVPSTNEGFTQIFTINN